jgi:hypothetical protein
MAFVIVLPAKPPTDGDIGGADSQPRLPRPTKRRDVVRAKRSGLGGADLAAILRHFSIPVARLARHCGVAEATAWRWVSGSSPVPSMV